LSSAWYRAIRFHGQPEGQRARAELTQSAGRGDGPSAPRIEPAENAWLGFRFHTPNEAVFFHERGRLTVGPALVELLTPDGVQWSKATLDGHPGFELGFSARVDAGQARVTFKCHGGRREITCTQHRIVLREWPVQRSIRWSIVARIRPKLDKRLSWARSDDLWVGTGTWDGLDPLRAILEI
jgi:hypothetical protein